MIDERDLDHLLNLARTELVGASDGGMKAQLYDVCHEFFADSNAWVEHLQVPILANVQDYTLIPQRGGMVLRLVSVWDTNFIVLPALIAEIEPPNAIMHLMHPQNVNQTARVVVIKQVYQREHDIPVAPRSLLPMYERVILDGLLGKMMGQSTKSYSNETLSTYHLRRFRDGIMQARVATERANVYGGQAWRYPNSFRSNSQRGGVSTPFPTDRGF
jgi:hypothetical protein